MRITKCPLCGKINELADADGYVDGPRAYHADCWDSLDDAAQAKAWEEADE